MSKAKRKILSVFLCLLLVLSSLAGCSSKKNSSECPYDEFLIIDVFDCLANFQGIQSGWFAKIIKDKFNIQLNIIAPNIAGSGDTLYDSMVAAGDLGDLIICAADNGSLEKLVDMNLLYNMEKDIKDKGIMRYRYSIDLLNKKLSKDGIYAIPSEISVSSPLESSERLDPTFGPFLRWDIYSDIGRPQMDTLEDMLTVLKQMQDAYPYTESGSKTYGFSFFSSWDGNLMNAVKQPCCFYGYDEFGFVLSKADGTDYQDILSDDSLYHRVLKLFFDANQMGLVDPESKSQTLDDVSKKYEDGSVFYTPWAWQGKPAFNSLPNQNEGKGYMFTDISDMTVFSYGNSYEGNQKTVIAVGSNTKDPERMVDFIDWLYSTEGIMANCAFQTDGSAGPKGLTWDLDEQGEPYLTDFGVEALYNGTAIVPDEWGGGKWLDGVSALNFKPVSLKDYSPEGYTYVYELWDSEQKRDETLLEKEWREVFGATNALEYLKEHDRLIVAPGSYYVAKAESSEIQTLRSQCRLRIVDYSWNMIFCENEETFDQLWIELKNVVYSLGYEQVLSVDMQGAMEQTEARNQAVSDYIEFQY